MSQVKFDFSNKSVLITGASCGIGKATAVKFAASGAKVMISDVNEDQGEQTVRFIQEAGGVAIYKSCDVSQASEVVRLIDDTVRQFGRLDIVCNNAGIEGEQAPTQDCSIENWDRVINTNLKGLWLCMKSEIPYLLKNKGGAIVNLSSIAGLIGFPGLPAYVASKHGIAGLTKTAALEYADKNIRVNAVCPGPIMTPMLKRLMSSKHGFEEQLIAGVPQKKIGTPEDIANTILFLSSDEAAYITGQCLAVDGGWVAQ